MTMLETDLLRILFAAVLGTALGLEREMKRKPLGLKTCLVITVSSCLITLVSFNSAAKFSLVYHFVDADPTRICAQIVSGIGFLGGGVILKKNNDVIMGLTTAAIIWAAGGFGIAAGAGYYLEALLAFALIYAGVEWVPGLLRKMGPKSLKEKEIRIVLHKNVETDQKLIFQKLEENQIKIENIQMKGNNIEEEITITATIFNEKTVPEIYKELKIEEITHLNIEILH